MKREKAKSEFLYHTLLHFIQTACVSGDTRVFRGRKEYSRVPSPFSKHKQRRKKETLRVPWMQNETSLPKEGGRPIVVFHEKLK